jgi:putative Holliday junction resolvase
MSQNFLGIDHGDRRIGLSYGDELGIAVSIAAAVEATEEERLAHLGAEIKRRRIHELVVGYPLNMDGSAGPRTKVVDAFIAELETRFKLPIHRVDEGLSSVEAE